MADILHDCAAACTNIIAAGSETETCVCFRSEIGYTKIMKNQTEILSELKALKRALKEKYHVEKLDLTATLT